MKKVLRRVRRKIQGDPLKSLAKSYSMNGYKRIYLYHIRKTGGTSLNNMFLSLSGGDCAQLYTRLAAKDEHRVVSGDKIYVGWDKDLINEGNYFYAFSHLPYHQIAPPKNTFTITCLRDPIKRVISHYSMLMEYKINRVDHPCMIEEGPWLGESFDGFLDAIPNEHLLNQLYMFSKHFEVDEAEMNIHKLSHYFFGDQFESGVGEINRKLGIDLEPVHIRKSKFNFVPEKTSLIRLKEMLEKEYELIERLRETSQ